MLHRSADLQDGRTGDERPLARYRVLSVGGGGDGQCAGVGGKRARCLVVGVAGGGQGRAVQRHDNVGQRRIKGVADHQIVGGKSLLIAAVFNDEGVGQALTIRYRGGAERLGDGQRRAALYRDRFARTHGGGHAGAGDGRGVGDGPISRQGGKLVRGSAIDQLGIAAGGDIQPADDQGVCGYHRGIGLGNAAYKIQGRAVHVRQRRPCARAEGVGAEVVGDGQSRQGGRARVDDVDEIRQLLARGIGVRGGRLVGRQHLADLTRDDVGVGGTAAIGQRCLVEKCCHRRSVLS